MKKEDLKVGMSCEVVTITAEEPVCRSLYKKGSSGIVVTNFGDRGVSSYIGNVSTTDLFIPKEEYKVVGRLTVTKIKK